MIKLWVLFWFNDYTRILGVVFGGHLLISLPVAYLVFGEAHLKDFAIISYSVVFLFALLDNDYSKLRRYGRDEYGKKINDVHSNNEGKV